MTLTYRAIWSDDGLDGSCDAARAAYAAWLNGFQLKKLVVPEDGTTTTSGGRAAWTEFDIEMSATAGRDSDAGIQEAYRADFRERFIGGHGVAYRNTTLRSWIVDGGRAGARVWTWVDTDVDGGGLLGWAPWEAPTLVGELLKRSDCPTIDGEALPLGLQRCPGRYGGLMAAEMISRRERTLPLVVVHAEAESRAEDAEPDPAARNDANEIAAAATGIALVFALDSEGARSLEYNLGTASELRSGAIRAYLGSATGESTPTREFTPSQDRSWSTTSDVCKLLASESVRRQPPASSASIDQICPPPQSNL